MSDSVYHITQSSKVRNDGPKHTHIGQPCFGIFVYEYICTVVQPLTL